MAWNQHGDGVPAEGRANGAYGTGVADLACDPSIGADLAGRDLGALLQDLALKLAN